VDGTAVTAIRTAAVSGVATKLLAREDAGDLAIIGAGTQASTHLAAMLEVRRIRRVRVYSDSIEGAQQYAERESKRHHIDVEPVESAEAAVRGADLICTVTTSDQPVLLGEWLRPGAHINAVGAFKPTMRELDTTAVVRSRMYVDRLESALREAGDFLIPRSQGAIGDEHIAGEIGQVLVGDIGGRRTPEDITLFKSLGIAVEDLAAANHILKKAAVTGRGTWIEMGGQRFATS
jgi:ornithine cyclodeaminase